MIGSPVGRVVDISSICLSEFPPVSKKLSLVAPLTEDIFIAKGSSPVTLPSNDSADGDRLVLDNEGNWQALNQDEAGFAGARRVENLIAVSEDMEDASYTATGGATVDSAEQVTFDGTNDSLIYTSKTIVDRGAGRTFIYSADIALVSGTIESNSGVEIRIGGNAIQFNDGVSSVAIGSALTATPQRFYAYGVTDASGTVITPFLNVDDTVTLSITNWMLEESTGRADTTTPSEYISSSQSPKVFTTTNGNTVDSNVVTEGEGTPLDVDGYFVEGAATEISGYSADLTNWITTTSATATKDAVGLTGASNEAFTVTDDSASVNEFFLRNIVVPNDSLTRYTVFRVAHNATPSVYPALMISYTIGTSINQHIVFDPSDGSYSEVNGGGSVVFVIRSGGFWFVCLSLTNNNTGNTNYQKRFYPAYNTDGAAAINVAAQGSTVLASAESYVSTWSYSPILTTGGSTFARPDSTGATLPLPNWPDTHGSIEFDLTPEFDVATGASQGIITPNATSTNGIAFHTTFAKRLTLFDGSNLVVKTSAWSTAGQAIHVKARWNAATSKMNLSVDGVAATEGTFDGSFSPSGAITLFKNLTLGASMKNLKIYAKDKGAYWLTQ